MTTSTFVPPDDVKTYQDVQCTRFTFYALNEIIKFIPYWKNNKTTNKY